MTAAFALWLITIVRIVHRNPFRVGLDDGAVLVFDTPGDILCRSSSRRAMAGPSAVRSMRAPRADLCELRCEAAIGPPFHRGEQALPGLAVIKRARNLPGSTGFGRAQCGVQIQGNGGVPGFWKGAGAKPAP